MAAKPGQGLISAQEEAPGLLTVPLMFQEMVGRGCPDASQDRLSIVFSFTHTFLSFDAIHGGPWGGTRGCGSKFSKPASH